MRCRKVQKLISTSLDGALDEARAAAVRSHVSGCHTCRAFASDLAQVGGRLDVDRHLETGLMCLVNGSKEDLIYTLPTPRIHSLTQIHMQPSPGHLPVFLDGGQGNVKVFSDLVHVQPAEKT